MNKAVFLVPVLAVANIAVAEPIQYEIDLFGDRYNTETSSAIGYESERSSYSAGLSGTHYLTPLETAGVVQNELIFLRRASFVSGHVSHYESDFDYTTTFNDGDTLSGGDNSDERSGGIGGQYFVNESTFIGGYYSKTFASGSDGVVSVHGGYYYSDTSAVSAGLRQHIGESDSTSFFISNKSVLALSATSSLAYSVGAGAGLDHFEESVSIDFDTTYYFTNHTGVGIGGSYHIDASEFAYALSFNHYFNDRIGVDVWVAEPDEGLDYYGAALTGRF